MKAVDPLEIAGIWARLLMQRQALFQAAWSAAGAKKRPGTPAAGGSDFT
jgi:hypothetical protein